jgi:hypothetical protein
LASAAVRRRGGDTEVYRAQRQVARIILAHECNLTQPSVTAPRRNSRSEARPTRGVESAESAGTSGIMDFTVPLDRQSSRKPDQTYVLAGWEGWSQDSCTNPIDLFLPPPTSPPPKFIHLTRAGRVGNERTPVDGDLYNKEIRPQILLLISKASGSRICNTG